LRKVVKQFKNQSPETRCFQNFNQLWNQTVLMNLKSNHFIERDVKQQSKRNL
jgi:hypothetical protein